MNALGFHKPSHVGLFKETVLFVLVVVPVAAVVKTSPRLQQ